MKTVFVIFELVHPLNPISFFSSTFSRLIVFFKQEQFMASKRLEFHSVTDFLANSGGLFGLFMGASLLSFVEFIYFFTLRQFCEKRTKINTKHQSQPKEKVQLFTILPRYSYKIKD